MVLIPSFGNYSFLRAMRAFRALKTLKAAPGLRLMIDAIFRSMRGLSDVLLLLLFTIVVFAIIGIEYFAGLKFVSLHPVSLFRIVSEEMRQRLRAQHVQ
jgi:hypothetical protein